MLEKNKSNKLVHSPYYKTNIIHLSDKQVKDIIQVLILLLYICVEGSIDVVHNQQVFELHQGETLLIPAEVKEVALESKNVKIIEVYI